MSLKLNIEKKLGAFQLKVDLEAGDEVLALLGASGCGKSLTLRCVAGIETPDRGQIVLDGRVLFDSDKKINLSPQKRHTGLIFQNYALFPNMTVEDNLLCATRRDRHVVPRSQRLARVKEIMEDFGLSPLARQLPSQLSGGQQQRVALARSLISSPDILLLDEPFSALDSHMRFRLEQEVRDIIRRFGRTVVLVSHDRDEVFRMSDKIAVMNDGYIDVFGPKEQVFAHPGTRCAAELTGCKNISPIQKLDDHHVYAKAWGLTIQTEQTVGDESYVGIRMHDISYGDIHMHDISYGGTDSAINSFIMEVAEVVENPFSYTVLLRGAHEAVCWKADKALWKSICRRDGGEGSRDAMHAVKQVRVRFPQEAILLLK
jgi:molybdate transport system ATP-binding protein